MEEKENTNFVEMLKTVEKPLTGYALSLCRDRDEAQDLIQETILTCFLHFEEIKDKAAFKPYIFKIAHRIFFRSKWRKRLFIRLDEAEAEQITDTGMQVEQSLAVKELVEAMQKLKPIIRDTISLHEFSGLPIKEIAEIQKTNVNTVKTRLRRGRQRLAELLEVENQFSDSKFSISNAIPKEGLL